MFLEATVDRINIQSVLNKKLNEGRSTLQNFHLTNNGYLSMKGKDYYSKYFFRLIMSKTEVMTIITYSCPVNYVIMLSI